ncbi:MAG TPA: hypothetical protein VM534_11350 [Thermoanaerobaculia bacterium]|nr:hypothetical protein [Thermoanaerobaculia bacterium]
MRTRGLIFLTTLLAFWAAAGFSQEAPVRRQKTVRGSLELAPGGTLILDNPQGNILVEAGSGDQLEYEAVLNIQAADAQAGRQALSIIKIGLGGDANRRLIRTLGSFSGRGPRWSSAVNYTIRVPRQTHLQITSFNSRIIEVRNLKGAVAIKNFHGRIRVVAPGTPLEIDSVNGDIGLIYTQAPTANAMLATVNGNIDVVVPRRAALEWRGETLKGDILASASIEGVSRVENGARLFEASFGKGGSRLLTSTMTGNITVTESGAPRDRIRSVLGPLPDAPQRPNPRDLGDFLQAMNGILVQPPTAREFAFHQRVLLEDLQFATELGNILIGDVRGSATLMTHAGEIVVGRVFGDCRAESRGGPLNLGEIRGHLHARTRAGDVLIGSSLRGGIVSTGGGNIQVRSAAGPLSLVSGGGDVVVHETVSGVQAKTRGGDIVVSVAPSVSSARLDLSTTGGNAIVKVGPDLAADVDMMITITDGAAYTIESDLPGLTMTREKIGDEIRIRATGSTHGGGAPLFIRVQNGNIELDRD